MQLCARVRAGHEGYEGSSELEEGEDGGVGSSSGSAAKRVRREGGGFGRGGGGASQRQKKGAGVNRSADERGMDPPLLLLLQSRDTCHWVCHAQSVLGW